MSTDKVIKKNFICVIIESVITEKHFNNFNYCCQKVSSDEVIYRSGLKCYTGSIIKLKKESENKKMKQYKVLCDNKQIKVLDTLNISLSDISLPFDRDYEQVSSSPITIDVIANNCLEALEIAKKTYFAQYNRNPFSVEVSEKVVEVSMPNQLALVA